MARAGARYLGNTNTMEVHDTWNESGNCQLSEIKSDHKRWYDSLAAAIADGFDPCSYCLSGSAR